MTNQAHAREMHGNRFLYGAGGEGAAMAACKRDASIHCPPDVSPEFSDVAFDDGRRACQWIAYSDKEIPAP